jgi:hypothetical protein
MVFSWLGVLGGWLAAGLAPGGEPVSTQTAPTSSAAAASEAPTRSVFGPVRILLDELPARVREQVRTVVEQPTLATHGPVEAFDCQPPTYSWLLDHPDQAVRLWRHLGAKCMDIENWGAGSFGWHDSQGSAVHWETVLRTTEQRIWYAEGRIKPGVLLPPVLVRAVVVVQFHEGWDRSGHPAVRHQMHLVLRADSHAVALATRLLGSSAPHMAEQYVGQMEMFFGALAWYLDQHPDQAEVLFKELQQPVHTGSAVPNSARTDTTPAGWKAETGVALIHADH